MKPTSQYIVTTPHGPFELDRHDLVIKFFNTFVNNGVPVRVFRLDFDVETNAFETASEITADLAARLV